jgi:hypothetical protein
MAYIPSRHSNCRGFLETNYHVLCKSLKASDFFSWLRSKNVLTVSDQEEIRHERTSLAQMGQLVDIIQRKGESGFDAFMEVIEYTSPETFSSLTGEVARDPPSEFTGDHYGLAPRPGRARPMSMDILAQMGDLVKTLSAAHISSKKAVIHEKKELSRLQEYVSEIEENIHIEKSALYLEVKCANEKIQMLEAEKGLVQKSSR